MVLIIYAEATRLLSSLNSDLATHECIYNIQKLITSADLLFYIVLKFVCDHKCISKIHANKFEKFHY